MTTDLMAGDDDQRQVERVSGSEKLKSRVRKLGTDRSWKINNQFNNQFPQFEWADHRVQEPEMDQVLEQMRRTQKILKRNVSESQRPEARKGKAKMLK